MSWNRRWEWGFMGCRYLFGITIFSVLLGAAGQGATFDASGYLRSGTGWSGSERRLTCVSNSGAPTNEFRLGNECSIYGELGLVLHHVDSVDENAAGSPGDKGITPPKINRDFFDSRVRFSMFPEGRRLYDSADVTGRGINLTEAYAEARYADVAPFAFWAGKRFYRENDISIFDWYSFGDTSGVGAGISMIEMPKGDLSIAHLIQGSESTPSTGVPILQWIDLRWRGIPLTDHGTLLVWTGYAWSSRGTDGSGTSYLPGHGGLLGFQWKQEVSFGRNELALIYGRGLMQGMNLYGPNPMTDPDSNEAERVRLTESFEISSLGPWSFLGVLATDEVDSGKSTRARSRWRSVGLRSFYQMKDHLRLVFELGHSRYQAETEVDSNGAEVGERSMSRLTVCPELSANRSIWGRPVLRAYASYTTWDDANRAKMATTNTALGSGLDHWNFGYQMEMWF